MSDHAIVEVKFGTAYLLFYDIQRVNGAAIDNIKKLAAASGSAIECVGVLGNPSQVVRTVDSADRAPLQLTGFETEGGPAYLALSDIVGISQPVQKGSRPVCRALMVKGGHKVYVTENEANRAKLLPLLPDDAAALAQANPPKPSRGPGRPPKAAKAPDGAPPATEEPHEPPAGAKGQPRRRGRLVTSRTT